MLAAVVETMGAVGIVFVVLILLAIGVAGFGVILMLIGLSKKRSAQDKTEDDSEACIYGGGFVAFIGVAALFLIVWLVRGATTG